MNVHKDFTLGYTFCIVHFLAKRLSFCGSNKVFMLHIESCNRSLFLFPLARVRASVRACERARVCGVSVSVCVCVRARVRACVCV